MALDLAQGKMYVLNNGTPDSTVSRASLDGTGGESLGNLYCADCESWTFKVLTGIALELLP
jgi:hypothetical protein